MKKEETKEEVVLASDLEPKKLEKIPYEIISTT
jgi:hypothetical protein